MRFISLFLDLDDVEKHAKYSAEYEKQLKDTPANLVWAVGQNGLSARPPNG